MLPLSTRPFLSASILAALLVAPLSVSSAWADSQAATRLIDVQAHAEQQVIPDKASLSARLWERTPAIAQRDDTQANPEALAKARTRLEERAANLIQQIEAAGLSRDAITAGSLNVQPEIIYEPSSKDSQQDTPMARTRIERPFKLEITNLDQLPTLLDALTEAGVNSLDGVTYDLQDRDAASDATLKMALERARHKAELMSDTLGVNLGAVNSISEQQVPNYQPRMMAMASDVMEKSGGGAEYRPGTITLESTVNVRWEISE
ncbi:SIMPL domain-containing protein [Halomonas halocynthiae]|uniref:SIMPL domain-containing protein n=1 Tax=Halomonas halocynthiae TaxID=176290 RepID=UPI00041D0CD8|nr:SIMPL domain-containing protein [Halomonas halocynthiae]